MDVSRCIILVLLLASLIHTVQLHCSPNVKELQNEQNPINETYLSMAIKGVQLVKRCAKTNPFDSFQNLRYASEIHQLEKKSRDCVEYQMPAQLSPEFQNLRHLYELGSVDERKLNETIVPKLTNDPQENAMMLQQMGPDGMPEGAFEDTTTCNYNGSGNSDFVVGLEKNLFNLERILLQREVSVVGVQSMGGVSKRTMAVALSNDQEIKGVFRNNIIFITGSRGILETMWEKIIRKKKPEFQNIEEAHRQLQQLLMQAKRTLVVLDDVWAIVTTRDRSTIPATTSTQFYELSLLEEADALLLFCFWAFGQRSIPSNVDEQLVKQVQAKCKCLPLALNVIARSLHGEPCPLWESAKNKLLNGESISDYHKEGLLRCLEPSIDVLDEVARECFLDLGSFPEDRKNSVDALLDICVYVRKMESQDAFVIMLEFASNLRSQAIKYGSASELFFSQHNVMRDLALYLASRSSVVRRKRLFMPRKEDSLPGKWELLNDQAFDAQIVSIHTGTNMVSKVALNRRLSHFGSVLYEHAVVTPISMLFTYILNRKTRPNLSFSTFCEIFFSSMFGLERIRIISLAGEVKVLGAVICMAGAALVTLCKPARPLLYPMSQQKWPIFLGLRPGKSRGVIVLMLVMNIAVASKVAAVTVNNTETISSAGEGISVGDKLPSSCYDVGNCGLCFPCYPKGQGFLCCDQS